MLNSTPELLSTDDSDIDPAAVSCVKLKSPNMLQVLLDCGVNINAASPSNGDTALHTVVKQLALRKSKEMSSLFNLIVSAEDTNPTLQNNDHKTASALNNKLVLTRAQSSSLKALKKSYNNKRKQQRKRRSEITRELSPVAVVADDSSHDVASVVQLRHNNNKQVEETKEVIHHQRSDVTPDELELLIDEAIAVDTQNMLLHASDNSDDEQAAQLTYEEEESDSEDSDTAQPINNNNNHETAATRTTTSPINNEHLMWEIEMSDNVINWLRIAPKRHPKAFDNFPKKLLRLARGEWSKGNHTYAKPLKHCDSDSVHLYETKLTKAARIVWDIGVSYSESMSTNDSAIYTDCIRLWDIVMNHDNLDRTIRNIERSVARGANSDIKKCIRSLGK